MKRDRAFKLPLATAFFLVVTAAPALTPVDHTGAFESRIGEISIMLGNGEAIVSYSAVFGASAHTCDWVATGRDDNHGAYVFNDGSSVVKLSLTTAGAQLEPVDGVPTFCGAGWPGDRFGKEPAHVPERCTVKAERAFFYSTESPPTRRKAYVVRGDGIVTLPCRHEGGAAFVLARFSGPRGATIGLLRRADLQCSASK
jgi:hypothetical protein